MKFMAIITDFHQPNAYTFFEIVLLKALFSVRINNIEFFDEKLNNPNGFVIFIIN